MPPEDTKDLGLGVLFQAKITDFGNQLADIKKKLQEFATQIDAMGKTGAKASETLVKAQEKVAEATKKATTAATVAATKQKEVSEGAAKSSEKLVAASEQAAAASSVHGRSLAQARLELKGLDGATISQIQSSKMSSEMFDKLSSRIQASSGTSTQYRKALADMAFDSKNNVLRFDQLANALKNNEKYILQTEKAFSKVRAQLGVNALPKDLSGWATNVDRVKFAQAALNGELFKSGGVVLDSSTKFMNLQRQLASLRKEYGPELFGQVENRLGSYIKKLPLAADELKKLSQAQVIANSGMKLADSTVSGMVTTMNQLGRQGDAWASGVNKQALASGLLQKQIVNANGQLIEMGKAFGEVEQKATKTGLAFKKNLSPESIKAIDTQLGTNIRTWGDYEAALKKSSDRAVNAKSITKDMGEIQTWAAKNAQGHAKAVQFLTTSIQNGGITLREAKNALTNQVFASDTASKASVTLANNTEFLKTKYSGLIANTASYGETAKKLMGTMEGTQQSFRMTQLQLDQLNKTLLIHEKGVASWNNALRSVKTSIPQVGQFVGQLKERIASGNLTHAEAVPLLKAHVKELGNLGKVAGGTTSFWTSLTGKIIGGGAAAQQATGYMANLGRAVGSLAAWIPAALIIGGLTAIVGGAVRAVIGFNQSLKSLQAISQGTDAEIALLGEEMLRISNTTRYSLTEIGKGAIYIAQAGFTAGESLQVLAAAARGAQGTLEPLTTAADLLTTVIRAFQLDAREASSVMDMLAMAANKSKTDLEGMKVVFNYLGPTAKAAGVSLSETLGALMLMSNVGMRMSTIGTSLRQVFIALENPNARLQKALAAHGMTVQDLSVKKLGLIKVCENLGKVIGGSLTNAVQFFNVRAGNTALVLSTMPEYLKLLIHFSLQYGAATAMAGKQTEGLEISLRILLNRFQNFFVVLSEGKITGLLKNIVDGLVYLMTILYNFARSWQGSFIGSFLVFGAVGFGIIKVLQLITKAIEAMTVSMVFNIGVVKRLQIAFATLQIWAMTNPITAAILAIAALGAAIYTFIKTQEMSSEKLQKTAILYTENAIASKKLSETLSDLKKQQDAGTNVMDGYLATLKQIREKFPELIVRIVKTNNDLKKQSIILAENAKKWEERAEAAIKASVAKLASDINEMNKTLDYQNQALSENKSMWVRWLEGVAAVMLLANLPLWIARLFGVTAAVETLTIAWEKLKGALHFTKEEADYSLVKGIAELSEKERKAIEEASEQISAMKKELREPLFLKFEIKDLQPLLRQLVEFRDREKEAIKAGVYTEGALEAIAQSEEIAAKRIENAKRTAVAINNYEMAMLENRYKKGIVGDERYYSQKEQLVKKQYGLEAQLIEATWAVQDEKHKRTIANSTNKEARDKAGVTRRLDEMKKEEVLVLLGYKKKEALDNLSTEQELKNIKRIEDSIIQYYSLQEALRKMSLDKTLFDIKERQTFNDWLFSNNLIGEKEYNEKSLELIAEKRDKIKKDLDKQRTDYLAQFEERRERDKWNDDKTIEMYKERSAKLLSITDAKEKADLDATEAGRQALLALESRAEQIRLRKIEEFYAVKEILRKADFDKEMFEVTEREILNNWLFAQNLIKAEEFYAVKKEIIDKDWKNTKANLDKEFYAFEDAQEKKKTAYNELSEEYRRIDAETYQAYLTFLDNMDKADRDHLAKNRQNRREEYENWEMTYSQSRVLGVVRRFTKESWAEFSKWGERIKVIFAGITVELTDSLSSFFEDTWKGELKSANDYFKSFADNVMKIFFDMIAEMIAKWIMMKMMMIGSEILSLVGVVAGAGGGTPAGGFPGPKFVTHEGGVIGKDSFPTRNVPDWLFSFAPRLHKGLAFDEFAAILQKGERVWSKEQVAAGAAGGMTVNVPISIDSSNKRMISDLRLEIEDTVVRVIRRYS